MLRSVGVRQYRECSRFLNPLCKRKAKQAVSNDTVPTRVRARVCSSETGCVLLLFYFRLFSDHPSMPNKKREKGSIYL